MGVKKKRKQALLIRKLILGSMILLPLLLIFALLWPVSSTYSISVKTEIIKFKTLDDNISKIPFYGADIYESFFDTIPNETLKNGTFKLAEGATTKIERISKSNSVLIQINGRKDLEKDSMYSAGTFYKDDDEISHQAGGYVEFIIDSIDYRVAKGETIIIPITGHVTVGRSINYEVSGNSSAILREGKVVVIGKSILGKKYYKSETFDLNFGDQFEIGEIDKNDDNDKAYGFVSINEESGMTAAYKVVGKEGRIITPGPIDNNSGYLISTSLMSRFLYDPVVNGISIALAFLVLCAEIVPFIQSIYPKAPEKKKK